MKSKKNTDILGNCETNTQYNYNKMALLSALLNGDKVTILDDGEEYKPIINALGVDCTIEKSTNSDLSK